MRGLRRDELSERDAGFTLVELVVAMLVIAIVLIAVITVQARALTTNADSQARQAATATANQAMEELRSMPWNFLRKGLSSKFLAASGGDPFVTVSGSSYTLHVNGASHVLLVGSTGSDQNLLQPWLPLFDKFGSNKQIETSPSGNGDTITVRSYVTSDNAANNLGAVGLVVIASWKKRTDGSTEQTVLTSTAYAPSGGCGDLNNAPYLSACQARFEATASTSPIEVSVVSTGGGAPLLPTTTWYSLQSATGTANARVQSQQVATPSGSVSLGGLLWDDNSDATSPVVNNWISGSTQYSSEASNDPSSGDPLDASTPATDEGSTNAPADLAYGALSMFAHADGYRAGSTEAHTTLGCSAGPGRPPIPASAPCGHGSVADSSNTPAAMGLKMTSNAVLNFAQVSNSGASLTDDAWAVRLTSAGYHPYPVKAPTFGCSAPSVGLDSNCGASGAQKNVGTVLIGALSSDNWDSGKNYLVAISNYKDYVSVARGLSPANSMAAYVERSASLSYWDPAKSTTSYQSVNITKDTDTGAPNKLYAIGPAKWVNTNDKVTIEATGTIAVKKTSDQSTTDCKADQGCWIDASNGQILITVNYTITPDSGSPWSTTVITIIEGSRASALYKEAPGA